MLTSKECLIVAEAAEKYPKGFGYEWTNNSRSFQTENLIRDFPREELKERGCPAVQVALYRAKQKKKRLTVFLINDSYWDVMNAYGDFGYSDMLNNHPKKIARKFTKLAKKLAKKEDK